MDRHGKRMAFLEKGNAEMAGEPTVKSALIDEAARQQDGLRTGAKTLSLGREIG
jgi:hypothetical protein